MFTAFNAMHSYVLGQYSLLKLKSLGRKVRNKGVKLFGKLRFRKSSYISRSQTEQKTYMTQLAHFVKTYAKVLSIHLCETSKVSDGKSPW